MRKSRSSVLAVLALVAVLAQPGLVGAVTYEDSFEDCHYPKMADLFVIKPVGFLGTVFGTVLFVGFSPWILVSSSRDFPETADTLVVRPARFTFVRPLGECWDQPEL